MRNSCGTLKEKWTWRGKRATPREREREGEDERKGGRERRHKIQ